MSYRYAVVAKVRMQVNGFVNSPKPVNLEYHIIVDLENHPQKDEVDINWFYNEDDNSFSEEGEVIYPDAEPTPEPEPEPISEAEQAIYETAANTEYLVCLAELNME